jgi:hypothetical protein
MCDTFKSGVPILITLNRKISEAKYFVNLLRKIERGLTVLALAPLSGLEKKERDRRLDERLRRLEQKHNRN